MKTFLKIVIVVSSISLLFLNPFIHIRGVLGLIISFCYGYLIGTLMMKCLKKIG